MPRGSNCGRSGDAAGEAGFPSALVVASRAFVSRLPARDTAVPLWLFRSSPRVLRWTGDGVDGKRCPCGFRNAERFIGLPAPAAVLLAGTWILCSLAEWRLSPVSTSLVWLAIRTSGSYLNPDERMAGAQPEKETERASNSADRCPSAGHAPWAPLRPAYRYPTLTGRRATWPTAGSSCPLDPLSRGYQHVARDRQRSWGLGCPSQF